MYRDELIAKANTLIGESIDYAITMLGNSGVIVEGYTGIRKYSKEEIVLRIRKKCIFIYGENMSIAEIGKGEIFVIGRIVRVSSEEEDK